jgi:cyclopropane fatty-acyl-phospholipid synthase-like methyltransferase
MNQTPRKSEAGETGQENRSLTSNAQWFADNETYKSAQEDLELYRFIALAAAHETEGSRALLDIGNGGIFAYPISHIPRVVAIDVFVEDDFGRRYPRVEWRQLSALEMSFSEEFDTVLAINTLHHIVGTSVAMTYANLHELLKRSTACLAANGKVVLIESTMPRWFVWLYGWLFPVALKIWPLSHPPTFQFHYRDILHAAETAGLRLSEFTWIPKTSDFIFLGLRVKRWMAPIRVGKFVFTRVARQSADSAKAPLA